MDLGYHFIKLYLQLCNSSVEESSGAYKLHEAPFAQENKWQVCQWGSSCAQNVSCGPTPGTARIKRCGGDRVLVNYYY